MMAIATETGVLMQGEFGDPIQEEPEPGKGCGSCFPSFWRGTSDDDRFNLLPQRKQSKGSWLKKLKDASELLGGPKWKNLLRKVGAYFNNNQKKKDFQYNSFNYTLNFDDGVHEDGEDAGALGFSSRFAPPVTDQPR